MTTTVRRWPLGRTVQDGLATIRKIRGIVGEEEGERGEDGRVGGMGEEGSRAEESEGWIIPQGVYFRTLYGGVFGVDCSKYEGGPSMGEGGGCRLFAGRR